MAQSGMRAWSRREWMRAAVLWGLSESARADPARAGLFEATELHHLVLAVLDPGRSEDFYRRLLGPGRLERLGNARRLAFRRDILELIPGAAAGMDHFSIAVKDFDAEAVCSRLEGAGWKPERRGADTVVVTDPDGIAVGLCRPGHGEQGGGKAAESDSLFRAVDLNHVALRVADVGRSRDFYRKLLGLEVISESAGSCFLSLGTDFLALFGGRPTGRLDHFCVSIEDYTADRAAAALAREGRQVRRTADRIYFPDPDGLTVQLSAPGHGP